MKALRKAIALSNGFLAVTIDNRRRIIEQLSDNEVIAKFAKYPQAENKKLRMTRKCVKKDSASEELGGSFCNRTKVIVGVYALRWHGNDVADFD